MKNSIVHPFLYDKTRKYNFFLLLSSLQWRTFFKISLAEGFHVACPIVMQKPFHKVRMEAKRSHRSAMYLSWTLYLSVYLPIDKIDWQHGIFLRGTIFSIYTIHFAESRKFDLCVDIKRDTFWPNASLIYRLIRYRKRYDSICESILHFAAGVLTFIAVIIGETTLPLFFAKSTFKCVASRESDLLCEIWKYSRSLRDFQPALNLKALRNLMPGFSARYGPALA